MTNHNDHPFKGYASPNYTPVPDELFDEQLPDLSGAELKVLLYVIRRTFGFKRESDNISLSQMLNGLRSRDGRQLDRGVGLTKKTLLLAIKSLEEKQIVFTERRRSVINGDEPTSYRLNVAYTDAREITTPPVGEKLLQGGGGEITPGPWGKNYPTQDTERKTEGERENYSSNIRMHKNAELIVDNSESQSVKPHRNGSSAPPPRTVSRPDTNRTSSVGSSDTAFVSRDQRLPGEPEAISTVLKRGRGRPPKQPYDEARLQIQTYLQDFARELGDQAPIKSSVSRAYNLYTESGVPIARFIDALYQARAKTQERSASIKSRPDPTQPFAPKAKMAYYFAVLEDELGLRADDAADTARAVNTSRERIAADAER